MNRAAIEQLIPHAGAMCLLDGVSAWDDHGIQCHSDSHRRGDNPLRRDGRLASVHLVEYAAQAAAAHHGLMQQQTNATGPANGGVLAGLRRLEFATKTIHQFQQPLQIHARNVLRSPTGLIYDFEITAGNTQLACGQLTIALAPAG